MKVWRVRQAVWGVFILAVGWLLPPFSGAAEPQIPDKLIPYPVVDLKPGQKGTTFTVLQGDAVVGLETEIKGVVKNGLGPGFDLIIGQLKDPRTELCGAVHGMSGSPLFIDGKLVGALSRRLILFEKDGQCGFTPIGDMIDVARRKSQPLFAGRPAMPVWNGQAAALDQVLPLAAGTLREPSTHLGLPLVITGWQDQYTPFLEPYLKKLGPFVPVAGGTSTGMSFSSLAVEGSAAKTAAPRLGPGSALAGALTTGDLAIAATGTTTWATDKDFIGFGHPFVGLGSVEIPATTADIITVMPSYYMPHKISNVGRVVGTIRQDRLSAVAGVVDGGPRMATYAIRRTHQGEARPELKGALVRDPLLSPLAVMILTATALGNEQDASRDSTIDWQGRLVFKGQDRALEFGGIYSGDQNASMQAVFALVQPLGRLFDRFKGRLEIEKLEMTIASTEEERVWQIREVRQLNPRVRLGTQAGVRVVLENRAGAKREEALRLALPEELKPGRYQMKVWGGADRHNQRLFRTLNQNYGDPDGMLRVLADLPPRTTLCLDLLGNAAGMEAGGIRQEGLPSSVLEVFQSGKDFRATESLLNEKEWATVAVPVDGVVTGQYQLMIEVLP
jgi:hypothetical protein